MTDHARFHLVSRSRFVWLLAALVGFVVLVPLADMGFVSRYTTSIMLATVLMAAINTAETRRSQVIVAGVFSLIWLAGDIIGNAYGYTIAIMTLDAILIGVMIYSITIVMRPILVARQTDGNLLCGAISIYLMLGVAWTVSFHMLTMVIPDGFGASGEAMGWSSLLYFSLTTLTTLGYGDITPTNEFIGIWATLEAVVGQLYLAVLVARLVALLRS